VGGGFAARTVEQIAADGRTRVYLLGRIEGCDGCSEFASALLLPLRKGVLGAIGAGGLGDERAGEQQE
jgi:hypothetical protein